MILPYWEARHPGSLPLRRDGLRSLLPGGAEEAGRVHASRTVRTRSSTRRCTPNVKPSFIVDISAQFERRMAALLSYRSQYGESARARPVSRRSGDSRAPGRDRPLLRQPDRREIRRAVRGERDDAGGRHRRAWVRAVSKAWPTPAPRPQAARELGNRNGSPPDSASSEPAVSRANLRVLVRSEQA